MLLKTSISLCYVTLVGNKMTPNRNATLFFQKVYLSSLQGNKNGQICAPFALLKDQILSASWGFAP